MQSAPRLPADHFGEVLGRLPPDLDLDALARATRAVVRKRVVASGAALPWPGRVLRACDGPCVREPGRATAGWRVHGL